MATAPAQPTPAPRAGFAGWWLGAVLLCAAVLFPALSLVVLKWWDSPDLRWVHELHWRKHKLLDRLPAGPRLLVVGGSSALFGVDAELLEARLGLPVMNLGLHGGLGLRFFLVEARRTARRGDTVLLHLEPAQYTGAGEARSEMERNYALTYDPGYLLHLPLSTALTYVGANRLSDYAEGVERWDQRLRGDLPKGDPARWTGYPFVLLGPRGDLRADELPAKAFEHPALKRTGLTKGASRQVREFLDWSKAQGVRVVVTIPAMAAPAEPAATRKLREFAEDLTKWARKHELPMAGSLDEALLPPGWMLDSPFHPAPLGRRVRTELLGAQMAPLLGRPAPPPLPWLVVGPEPGWAVSAVRPGYSLRVLGTARDHPASITAQEVKEAAEGGSGMLCQGEAAVALLSAAGLACTPEPEAPAPKPVASLTSVLLSASADVQSANVSLQGEAEATGQDEFVRPRHARSAGLRLPWEIRLHATKQLSGQDRPSSSILVERNLVGQHDGAGWVQATLDPALGIVMHRSTSATASGGPELFRVTLPAADAVQ